MMGSIIPFTEFLYAATAEPTENDTRLQKVRG